MRVLAGILISALMSGMFAATARVCAAESTCSELSVLARVEVAKKELSLADLLTHGSCSRFQQAAAQVSLGATPRAGSVRVIDGQRVRQWLAGLQEGDKNLVSLRIPERIVVQRAAETKSCAAIARFIAGHASLDQARLPSRWPNELNCAAASGIPKDTPLELTKTVWNLALQRWEFALRCSRPQDCVPFLVWAREPKTTPSPGLETRNTAALDLGRLSKSHPSGPPDAPKAGEDGAGRLVKAGQTATLSWEQAGIRVVLPVTCLDAGGMGQFVRVRFKNAPRILLAEVVGEGRLRVNL